MTMMTTGRLFTHEEKRSLQGLRLADTSFDYVDFSGADLSRSVFNRVSLVGCDFRGARLTLATFHSCDLREAIFDGETHLGGSRFEGSILLGARGLNGAARTLIRGSGGVLLAAVLA